MHDREQLATTLARVLADQASVQLAYLFGSRATGRPRADSDLDLAVQYQPGLDDAGRERARRALIASLAGELGALGEDVDLVDLDRAGTAVAFRAIRDGRCVHSARPLVRTLLEARIARRYDDEAPRRRLFREAAKQAGARMDRQAHGRR